MNFSFFAAMGLVLWFGGEKVIAGEITVGTLAAVPHLHDHPADAGAPARPDGQFLRARLDLRHAAVRAARPRRSTSRTRPDATDLVVTEGVLRFDNVDFRYPGGASARRPVRHQLRGAARRDHRHRRPAGQRQVDHRPPDPALLRRDRRPHHHRRPGHPQGDAAVAAQGRRRGAAGLVPVHDLDREQHRLRRSLGARAAHRAGRRIRAAAQLHHRACRRLRHGRRRARRLALRRPAPAPVDRPQPDAAAAGAGLRRFHRGHRRRHRAAHPHGAEALRQGPRDAHHLAPAELADACRPDPVPRERPHRRARHARRAARARRPLPRALRSAGCRPKTPASGAAGAH